MQPPDPMEESNQDRKKDAVIESITSHYSFHFYIEKRDSTREKGRTKGRLLWFNWRVRTPYLISSHGRASFFQRSWWKGLERDFGLERDCSRNRSSCGSLGWSETISRWWSRGKSLFSFFIMHAEGLVKVYLVFSTSHCRYRQKVFYDYRIPQTRPALDLLKG